MRLLECWTLTRLVPWHIFTYVTHSRRVSYPGVYSTVALQVSLFSADPSTGLGLPVTSVASKTFFSQLLPKVSGYLVVPRLNTLSFDSGSVTYGVHYAVLLSSSSAMMIHQVASETTNAVPVSGAAVVYSSLFSINGGISWVSELHCRGSRLTAIKQTCAPSYSQTSTALTTGSATQTQSSSSSQTQTMRQTQTMTRSQPYRKHKPITIAFSHVNCEPDSE